MQIVVLALMVGLAAHDWFLHGTQGEPIRSPWLLWLGLLGAKVALGAAYWLACQWALRRLTQHAGPQALRKIEKAGGAFRRGTLALYALDLALGGLLAIRQEIAHLVPPARGNLVLISEVLFLLPTLALLGWAWWAYYPIDRRLREATLLRRLDAGQVVYPIWTRWQYVISQFRHQVAIILAPMLLFIAWEQALDSRVAEALVARLPVDPRPALMLGGLAALFLLAPLLIRRLWDTVPLADGDLRQRLLGMCRQHGVAVRELLLWQTFGGMINGAVVGFVAPLRYILLTDALLDMLPVRQVEAVMAHELGHVRRRHMFWMLVVCVATFGLFYLLWHQPVCHRPIYWLMAEVAGAAYGGGWDLPLGIRLQPPVAWGNWLVRAYLDLRTDPLDAVASLGAVGMGLAVFGWVSRRFERQADTFAVQHLARQRAAGEQALLGPVGRADDDAVLAELVSPAIPGGVLPGLGMGVAAAPGRPAAREPAAPPPPADSIVIDWGSATTMVDALQSVADLNNLPPTRHGWRHGSIRWRQNYLRGLVGRRLDRLPIDRQIFLLKLAGIAALVFLAAVQLLRPQWLA